MMKYEIEEIIKEMRFDTMSNEEIFVAVKENVFF